MKSVLPIILLILSLSVFAKKIEYKDKGKDFEGYMLKGDSKKKTIFIIHDWDGLNDYEIKRAKMLNELGYNVFAIDIYGKGVRPTDIKKKKETSSYYYQNRIKMHEAVRAGFNHAKKLGLNLTNTALVGYCFGGTVGLEMARNSKLFSSYYIFHGGLQTPSGQDYKKNKAKLYIYHGGADTSVTLSDVADIGAKLESEKQDYIIQIYSGAPHAFTHFGGERYRKVADKESWTHMISNLIN